MADAVAVLVIAVWVVTVATMLSVAEAAFAMVPTVHTPAAYEPVDGVADTNVNPAGSASATETLCALSGPLLVTVTVNVTLLFNAGVALLTVLLVARSALGTSTDAVAVLLAAVGSYVVVDAVAVFVIGVWVVTVATMLSVAEVAFAMVPTVHTPAAYEPVDGVADTNVNPAGSASATETLCALSGPLSVTVTVNVTLLFKAGVALLTVFVT